MMAEPLNLNQIERKAWKAYHQDGLMDIFLGMLMLAMAASAGMDNLDLSEAAHMGIFIGLEVLAGAIMWAGKHFVTTPRLGRVRFGPKRKKRKLLTTFVLAASVIVGLIMLGLFAASDASLAGIVRQPFFLPLIWALNCLLVFGAMAYLLEYDRLYIVGVIYGIAIPVVELIRQIGQVDAGPWVFLAAGLIVLAMGVTVFARFVRTTPVPEREGEHAAR